jgi:protein-disulfide isomerase
VYSDFLCPYCSRFALQTLPELKASHIEPGKLLLVFKHLPLKGEASAGFQAAEFAECARRQGRFWPVHDALFSRQRELRDEMPKEIEAEVGLDRELLGRCLEGSSRAAVQADWDLAVSFGLRVTPMFHLGPIDSAGRIAVTVVLAGTKPVSVFQTEIDKLLAAVAAK